jgi:hypothetical protein
MVPFDRASVERNVQAAETQDLLDRVTAYRAGMEPEAVEIIEEELARRGYDRRDIDDYAADECTDLVCSPEGWAYRCSFCRRPAVLRRWGWHKLWGMVAVPFPRLYYYCRLHTPESDDDDGAEGAEDT